METRSFIFYTDLRKTFPFLFSMFQGCFFHQILSEINSEDFNWFQFTKDKVSWKFEAFYLTLFCRIFWFVVFDEK